MDVLLGPFALLIQCHLLNIRCFRRHSITSPADMQTGIFLQHCPDTNGRPRFPESSSDDLRQIVKQCSHIRVQPFLSRLHTYYIADYQHWKRHCCVGVGGILGIRHYHGQSRWDGKAG